MGWGNNVHVNLHTHVMLPYGYLGVGWGGAISFMSTCTHTHTRHATLWLSWGGVGWGNNVHVNLHTHTSCYVMVILGWGGVGWGKNVHVNLHTHVMLRYGYLGVGWGGVGQ